MTSWRAAELPRSTTARLAARETVNPQSMWHRENPKQRQQQQQRETVNPQRMWHQENPKRQRSHAFGPDSGITAIDICLACSCTYAIDMRLVRTGVNPALKNLIVACFVRRGGQVLKNLIVACFVRRGGQALKNLIVACFVRRGGQAIKNLIVARFVRRGGQALKGGAHRGGVHQLRRQRWRLASHHPS
jgi:hypothetical protein